MKRKKRVRIWYTEAIWGTWRYGENEAMEDKLRPEGGIKRV